MLQKQQNNLTFKQTKLHQKGNKQQHKIQQLEVHPKVWAEVMPQLDGLVRIYISSIKRMQ
jgi:hypothetical protein